MRALLVTVALTLGITACSKPPPWPIPELVLPPGSAPAPIPDVFLEGDIGSLSDTDKHYITPMAHFRSWGKGFNNVMNWEGVAEHVKGILRPMDYAPTIKKYQNYLPEIPGTMEREDYVKVWESPEGSYLVVIVNLRGLRELGAPDIASADYVLIIEPMGMR